MKHLYSYKFRLKPTSEQEVLLNKHFGCVRFIYNHFLAKRIETYKEEKKSLNKKVNSAELPILKQKLPWLKEINAQSLQFSVECLDTAYKNFFRKFKQKVKVEEKKGFPRFKNKSGKQSFRVLQRIYLIDEKLKIPKFLEGISVIKHRKLEGEIRFATISKNKANQYYVSITVSKEILQQNLIDKTIGIDLNIMNNVDSNGTKYENPRPAKQYEKRLKLLHKQLSRKTKNSKNRNKARIKLAKLYLKITNKREDYLHKLSHKIINENQVICCENLNVNSMLIKASLDKRNEPRFKEKNRHRNIQDCGWSSFINKLKYKAEWYGREFIQISRWFPSSQLCNHCGCQNKELKPEERVWFCWNCWENIDRDFNSAKNILAEGIRIRTVGTTGIAYCPDVNPAL